MKAITIDKQADAVLEAAVNAGRDVAAAKRSKDGGHARFERKFNTLMAAYDTLTAISASGQ